MVRYYFELNSLVTSLYGGHRYLTAQCEKPFDKGWMPRIGSHGPGTFHRLLMNSDRVILCDDNGMRFIKNRSADPEHAVVDPDEFFEIKMRSVEFG